MTQASLDPFDEDALHRGGYRYTTEAGLSSHLANERITRASVAVAEWRGKRVIDIGCGDGTYTAELMHAAGPLTIHGVDPAPAAIGVARERTSDPRVSFAVASAHELPHIDGEFDLAYLRGVLHHVDRPAAALAGRCGSPPYSWSCLLYTSPSPRDGLLSRMPSSA